MTTPTIPGFYWTDTIYTNKRPVLVEVKRYKGELYTVCHGGSGNCWAQTTIKPGNWLQLTPPTW